MEKDIQTVVQSNIALVTELRKRMRLFSIFMIWLLAINATMALIFVAWLLST